jgi:hypothetical protein
MDSWPARRSGRGVRKRMNSNIDVMYMCVSVCIWCCAEVLFTCILVLGRWWGRERWVWNTSHWSKQQDVGWARVNKKIRGQRELARAQSDPGSRLWRTYSRGAARRLKFKYVQSHNCAICLVERTCWEFVMYLRATISCGILLVCYCDYLYPKKLSMILIVVYFQRLKINHDSHEFILESGTNTNNNTKSMWFCCASIMYMDSKWLHTF